MTGIMLSILLPLMIALPLGAGAALVVLAFVRPGRSARLGRWVALAVAGSGTLAAAALALLGEHHLTLGVWLPNAGPMGLHTGGIGGLAALIVAAGAVVALLLELRRAGSAAPAAQTTAAAYGLGLIALGGAATALLADHFLLRYVALEVVALCVALAPLAMRRAPATAGGTMREVTGVYLMLRLGDAGLLWAILILAQAAGTLGIDACLVAGATLPRGPLTWTVVGLLLAVWVKTGAWPLRRWQAAARDLGPFAGDWLYGGVMPVLGLYLLYRITPLLRAHPWLPSVVIAAAACSTAVALLAPRRYLRRMRAAGEAIVPTRLALLATLPMVGSMVIAGLAPALAAAGALPLVSALVLAAVPLRLGLAAIRRRAWSQMAAVPVTDGGWAALMHVIRWMHDTLEIGLLEHADLMRVVRWMHDTLEIGLLERAGRLHIAARLHDAIEIGFLERTSLLRGVGHGALAFSRRLQRRHTGRLRANVAWMVMGLVLLVVWALFTPWH